MKVRNRHSRLAYKRCSIAIYLAVFICNTLLCRLREEDIVVVIFIFMAIMKRLSIFIRVICNNRQFHFDIFSILQLFPLNYFLPNWQESGGGWWAIHLFFYRNNIELQKFFWYENCCIYNLLGLMIEILVY